ncbi:MAG: response regulator [Candidatus Coatesbacteria bacterium]|nr:response regulator [Candidatus Coatesbacteria bacterium]
MNNKVLIVDDAIFMRALLKDILTNGGYTVVAEASNGREAIEQYKKHKPVVVLMDIVMPDMDGIEAVKEIMKYDSNAKVIMCSALGQQPLVLEALNAGAKEFIIKPFQAEKVLSSINSILS